MVKGQWSLQKMDPQTTKRLNNQTTKRPNNQTTKKHEEFKMEDGDSDTDKYPHRTGHNAGYD